MLHQKGKRDAWKRQPAPVFGYAKHQACQSHDGSAEFKHALDIPLKLKFSYAARSVILASAPIVLNISVRLLVNPLFDAFGRVSANETSFESIPFEFLIAAIHLNKHIGLPWSVSGLKNS